ncbi:MAG: alpha-amylase [Nitrospirota bacterium]|nr:MAG: alpha-amylase [Nitrospirota bacterium]
MKSENFLNTPLIYNLFPPLAGPFDRWLPHAVRAASLGFNWLFLNPVNYPGHSGSLYSTKDYYRLNPAFSPDGSTERSLMDLAPVIRTIRESGVHPMIDLVINHTAFDSPLVHEHPEWYVRDAHGRIQHPFVLDPQNTNNRTVWKDLAEIDNRGSSNRKELWDYWARLIETYMAIGFEGFRCDAAHQVPVELWQFLIEKIRRAHPHVVFWAENLGGTVDQTRALREAGFQFFCNSSKWWNFQDSWCLDQHEEFGDLPSISFPETHDTERVAKESGGSESIQRQRYAFAAMFSTGLMMPVGYEYGFTKRLHVVKTRCSDWETPHFDLSSFIQAVNRFKMQTGLFQGEGSLTRIPVPSPDMLVLERSSDMDQEKRGFIVVNTHSSKEQVLAKDMLPGNINNLSVVYLSWIDNRGKRENFYQNVTLRPSEVIVLLDNHS